MGNEEGGKGCARTASATFAGRRSTRSDEPPQRDDACSNDSNALSRRLAHAFMWAINVVSMLQIADLMKYYFVD
jgi:hypothetical protein